MTAPRDHDHDRDDIDHLAGYCGRAELTVAGETFHVEVSLRGFFHPVHGRYQWYGRIGADPDLAAAVAGRKQPVELATPAGAAPATIGDPDLWGRYRLLGAGPPPFSPGLTIEDD
jgi:hypothetical protein